MSAEKTFRIVDSFLFSEEFEKELLFLKLTLEDPRVDEWILIENAYTFRGEYKGLVAKEILENDIRFEKFLRKIKFISADQVVARLNIDSADDGNAFLNEYWQRNLAYPYFSEKYNDNDWILISDVDEMIDFTDSRRENILLDRMKCSEGILHVPVKRFWYDFDNEYKILYGIPLCTKEYLQSKKKQLADVRKQYHGRLQMKWDTVVGFEYSSCFKEEHIVRKCRTNSHAFSEAEVLKSLKCNHRIVNEGYVHKIKKHKVLFLETVRLTPKNSPAIIRENLDRYKTNVIDPNYKSNRKEAYPEVFSIKHYFDAAFVAQIAFIKKKFRFLMRRLGAENLFYKS